jgi:hypothetical protein
MEELAISDGTETDAYSIPKLARTHTQAETSNLGHYSPIKPLLKIVTDDDSLQGG